MHLQLNLCSYIECMFDDKIKELKDVWNDHENWAYFCYYIAISAKVSAYTFSTDNFLVWSWIKNEVYESVAEHRASFF